MQPTHPAPYRPAPHPLQPSAQFREWLERHGPFGAVIDGANVALFGQNFASGGFNFGQIRTVVDRLGGSHPHLKPLVVLHCGRTRGAAAAAPAARAFLRQLTDAGSFFATPPGSNDDWCGWGRAGCTAASCSQPPTLAPHATSMPCRPLVLF